MNTWRILLADRDPYTRELVRAVAAKLGAYSVNVDAGTQALHVLSSGDWLAAVCTEMIEPPSGVRLICLARRAGLTVPFLLLDDAAALPSLLPGLLRSRVVTIRPPLRSSDLESYLRQRCHSEKARAV